MMGRMTQISNIKKELRARATDERAKTNAWFFKTKDGEYGAGDTFIGVRVPDIRDVAKMYKDVDLKDIEALVQSKIHEERLLGLVMLVGQYESADEKHQARIYKRYLKLAKKHINNWDMVDLTAPNIVGDYTWRNTKERSVLTKLAKSKNLWEKRIAMVATYAFIRDGSSKEALQIAEMLLDDSHDLIHKAVGWMLREAWKKDPAAVETFLKKHKPHMPRTSLRYAIERMAPEQKAFFMQR